MTKRYFPEFSAETEVEIEGEQKKIHEKYWKQLVSLNETDGIGSILGNSIDLVPLIPPPVRQPKKLIYILRSYACELFEIEARRYPDNQYLGLWLNDLRGKVFNAIIDRIRHIERLDYHSSDDSMRDAIWESLEQIANRRFEGLPLLPKSPRKTASKKSPTTKGDRRALVDKFIAVVMENTGRKITRKHIWIVAGYSEATDFERFQRDDKRTSKSAVANFSRVLSMEPGAFLGLLDKRLIGK